jgi:glycyl-tRNA synthetase beta chain
MNFVTDTLLIEIGLEELPPGNMLKLAQAFADHSAHALTKLGLPYTQIHPFIAPRRLALQILEVPTQQPDRVITRKGPAVKVAFDQDNQPTAAAIGFARSCGVSVNELSQVQTPQGAWLTYQQTEPGQPLSELLNHNFWNKIMGLLPIVKRMRWGAQTESFIRPVHWLVSMHGPRLLPLTLFGITATKNSYGHRFHHPQAVPLAHANDYPEALKNAYVIADFMQRQQQIKQGIQKIAQPHQAMPYLNAKLLDDVTGLVEYPVPLLAEFDPQFLTVPPEALMSSMQHHQKCFPLMDNQSQQLLPKFVLISNTLAQDPQAIIHGNQRVMHARLADAKFFYTQDQKTPLSQHLEGLKKMVFQKQLGTLLDKTYRSTKLTKAIAETLKVPFEDAERAALLAKTDLLTEMVGEFPELQGVMGSYYALNEREPEAVAKAIREAYLPRFAGDNLPTTIAGTLLALADRLDTLVGIFGIGQLPTGDKDPFALRRAALGVLRILIENQYSVDLYALINLAVQGYGDKIAEETGFQVLNFCFERFRYWAQEQELSPKILEAVMAHRSFYFPLDILARARAIHFFQSLPEAQSLTQANKRVRNILIKAQITIEINELREIDSTLFQACAEKNLHAALEEVQQIIAPMIEVAQYQAALSAMAQLKTPVDAFLDEVQVMVDDLAIRNNRLNLLINLYHLFCQVADIAKL